jgi:UDP-GlcNAc:undecaprenyl-phosphate/decaprenyl-phosphate GlcNAc-1-phosphate transferase
MNYLIVASCSFLLSLVLVLAVLKIFPKLGLMDKPHKYGYKRAPVPYSAGAAFVLAFIIAVLFFVPIDQRVMLILLTGLVIAVVGFFDDRKSISPFLRLAMQIAAGLVLVYAGLDIKSISNPFGGVIEFSPVVIVIFSLVWVVFLMNALNWIDGISGLSSGVGTIASFVLFFLSVKSGFHTIDQSAMSNLALILGSVLFAFWLFDFYPPKVLMGDTGSMFVGFMLATLAVFAGGKIVTVFLVLGFPILDAIWTILRRILAHKSPFKGDLKHLHHRLLESGLKERQALLLIYSGCLVFGLLAIFLNTTQKLWAIILLLLVMSVIGFVAVYNSIKRENKN